MTALRLEGNPVYEQYPHCREVIVVECPWIRELDGRAVEEQGEGARIVEVERQRHTVEVILENQGIQDVLSACDHKVKVH